MAFEIDQPSSVPVDFRQTTGVSADFGSLSIGSSKKKEIQSRPLLFFFETEKKKGEKVLCL